MNLSAERLQVLQEKLARYEQVREELAQRQELGVFSGAIANVCVSLGAIVSASQRSEYLGHDARILDMRVCLLNLREVLTEEDRHYGLVNETLLLWTEYFPQNSKDDSGDLRDPCTRRLITHPVITATGYIFDRATLDVYYSQVSSYELDENGNVIPRNFLLDLPNTILHRLYFFGKHEIRNLLSQGVTLLKPEALLVEVSHASAFDQIDLTEDLPVMEKKMSRLTIAYYAKKGFELVGNVVGTLAFLALLAVAVSFIIPVTLLPASIIMWGFVACVEATIGMVGVDDGDFLEELSLTLASNGILLAGVALVVPQLMLALVSYSVISAAIAASIIAVVPALLIVLPIVNALVGFLDICYRDIGRSGYQGSYLAFCQRGIALSVYNVCHAVTGSLGALLGGVLGVAVNCFRPAVSYAEDAVMADFDVPHGVVDELAAENEHAALSSVISIANGLNVEPNAFVNQEVDAELPASAIDLNAAPPMLALFSNVEELEISRASRNAF